MRLFVQDILGNSDLKQQLTLTLLYPHTDTKAFVMLIYRSAEQFFFLFLQALSLSSVTAVGKSSHGPTP